MKTPDCCGEVVRSQAYGKEYNYCRGCKLEVPEGGWPKLQTAPTAPGLNPRLSKAPIAGVYPHSGDYVIISIDHFLRYVWLKDMNSFEVGRLSFDDFRAEAIGEPQNLCPGLRFLRWDFSCFQPPANPGTQTTSSPPAVSATNPPPLPPPPGPTSKT